MSSSQLEIPRRRNGRHQACEPCRRRKVSCGHEVPVCLRCRRRNTARDCLYIVDGHAMQFGPTGGAHPPSLTTAALGCPAEAADSEGAMDERSFSVVSPLTSNSNPDKTSGKHIASPPPGVARNPSAGYLGPTSFSAVYLETESNLALAQGQSMSLLPLDESYNTPTTPHEAPSGIWPARQSAVELELLNKGIEVLQLIPNAEMGKALFRQHINPNDGWNRAACERIVVSIYDEFGSALRQRGTSGLREMAMVLMENGKKELGDDIEDPDEWVASFSGRNLRWETLGIIFTYWAFGSFNYGGLVHGQKQGLDSLSVLWQDSQDRRPRAARFKEAAGACIELADQKHNPSTAMVCLLYRHTVLESNISGDASLALTKLHAEAVGVAWFAGMHAEPRTGAYIPTAASESRRRLFGMLFIVDKVHATFTGRPPFISRRYCSTPLPLDISNDVLMSDRATVAAAVAKLDANGWNTDGRIQATTILRARAQLAYVRDAILELSIGSMQDTSVENLLKIRETELETISKFPECLAYNPNDINSLETGGPQLDQLMGQELPHVVDGAAFYARVLVRLEHLKNMFFIERLLAHRRGRSLELLSISVDMVALTVVFWTHKNRLYAMNSDFEWLVMSYAAPGGGVLCMELMNPTPRPVDENGVELTQDPKLSRSSIIQNLSLLIGFLSWVVPSAPNGDLCKTVRDTIQRVMDYTLNNPAAPPTAGQPMDLAGAGLEIDTNDAFFHLDLMDTFDWLRPDAALDGMQPS